jgi:hypothetical protein
LKGLIAEKEEATKRDEKRRREKLELILSFVELPKIDP